MTATSPAAADEVGEVLELPAPWQPPTRAAVPLLASVVPVIGAVALWLVTGSVLSLWLAALGPLIAGATMLDSARTSRRHRRRVNAAAVEAQARVARLIGERHAQERGRLWTLHPDIAAFLARDSEIWRAIPGRSDALVVGSGVAASSVRVAGGGDDPDSARLRTRASRLEGAPILLPASAGIAVVGPPVLAAAVVRALALQLCLIHPPGDLRIAGPLRGENAWAGRLPHRAATGGTVLALPGPGEPWPDDADAVIVRAEGTPPPGCGAVLTVGSPERAVLDYGGELREIEVEAVGAAQAVHVVEDLAERAGRLIGTAHPADPIALRPLLVGAPEAVRGSLKAVVGVEADEPYVLDLVADGPHAVVAGVTGSGKSELLATWIVSLCATHSTRDVSFLLADFKGGTAFDALADVPHVTGVITDLDGAGARRAIESLRAEVRWREGELARAGARDIRDPRVELPRLVIVVDEFAALLGEHPELHAVFTDVAARGRALGMHLVLGTQRPSGVVRESLLANCPLRISLRVTDPADSRAIIGTAAAAALPGGAAGRGIALVRAAGDSVPRRVRIALSSASDVAAIAESSADPRPRRPWLPELPARIDLEDLVAVSAASAEPGLRRSDAILIGLADEPDQQRQRAVEVQRRERGLLVVGSGGSGKSTALRTIAAQASDRVQWIPATAEGAWDAVAVLSERAPAAGSIVLIDDLDAIAAALPPDYSRELLDRLERVLRGAGAAEILVVASAQRLGGGVARLAELMPRRLILASATRADHVAAGGDPGHYAPSSPPGRGRLDGYAVQVAMTPDAERPRPHPQDPWHPQRQLTGYAMRRTPGTRATIAQWERGGAHVITLDDFVGENEWAGSGPIVVVGDADEWQRHWRALSAMRSDHDLVVDVSCATELRALTGERMLPPYCEPGQPRAWLMSMGAQPVRIVLA
jgi:S-DNA-T family DNA segregation ATPase FtsK/SpoIIIE